MQVIAGSELGGSALSGTFFRSTSVGGATLAVVVVAGGQRRQLAMRPAFEEEEVFSRCLGKPLADGSSLDVQPQRFGHPCPAESARHLRGVIRSMLGPLRFQGSKSLPLSAFSCAATMS